MATAAAAAGIGILAGMRAMAAPATVSERLTHDGINRQSPAALRAFGSRKAARTLKLLALGEMAADKFPFITDRTARGALATRILSGAACGAALASWRRESALLGAIVGGAAAAGAAYAFTAARKAVNRAGLPTVASGLAEDALVAGGYWAANRALG